LGLERREDRGLPALAERVRFVIASPVDPAAFEPGIGSGSGDGVFDEVLTLAFG